MSLPKPFTPAHRTFVLSLYKRALKTSLNWSVRRDVWRSVAIDIRRQFEANRTVQDANDVKLLLLATIKTLNKYEHPEPIVPPSRPGGTKYERNAHPSLEEPVGGFF